MRVLAGYWTHAGYVNWDTGFGFRRWHQSKKLGLSQQALIGIATAPALAPHPSAPAWAKWMLDRGFEFYERELARNGDVPPGLFFGVHALPQPTESARLALARVSSNAARAIAAGLGSMRGERAAAAVRVRPRHRTAGGDDARLQHGHRAEQPRRLPVRRHRPRAALRRAPGGRGRDRRAAAGLVRAARARHLRPARLRDAARRPRPAAADDGAARRRRAGVGVDRPRPYAGPFQDLRAAGISRGGGWTRRTTPPLHLVLRPDDLVAAADRGRGRASADVLFPSWGRRGRGDRRAARRLGAAGRERADPARAGRGAAGAQPERRLRSCSRGGAPAARPCTCCTREAQSSAPLAGPTLAVQVLRASGAPDGALQRPLRPRGTRTAAETAARSTNGARLPTLSLRA